MARPLWSVVIPAFNEEARLPHYLDEVVAFLDGRGEPWEVVVVDDGSADDTAAVANAVARRYPAVRLLRLPANRGKGAAVRAGMLDARGEFRLFADADGATPIVELKRLESALAGGADVVIGSRALPDPAVSVRGRFQRRWAGRVFNAFVRWLALPDVADSQCGFKAFRAGVVETLFGALETTGFGFDVELLMRARRSGYRVAEVAVNWTDQPGGKVGVLSHGPGMLWQILRMSRRVSGA